MNVSYFLLKVRYFENNTVCLVVQHIYVKQTKRIMRCFCSTDYRHCSAPLPMGALLLLTKHHMVQSYNGDISILAMKNENLQIIQCHYVIGNPLIFNVTRYIFMKKSNRNNPLKKKQFIMKIAVAVDYVRGDSYKRL